MQSILSIAASIAGSFIDKIVNSNFCNLFFFTKSTEWSKMCIFCSFSFEIESCAFFFVFLFYYSVLWKTANICFLSIFKSCFPFFKIIVNVSCFDLNNSKNIHVWRLFKIVKCKYATRRETFGKNKWTHSHASKICM